MPTLNCQYYGTPTHTASVGYPGHSDVLGDWEAAFPGQVQPQQCCGGCAAYLVTLQPYYITALEFQQRIFSQAPGFTMKLIRACLAAGPGPMDQLMDLIDCSGGAVQIDINPVTDTGAQTCGGIAACVGAGMLTQAQANVILAMD